MSFISVGIAGAGVAASLAGSMLAKGSEPTFNYTGGNSELLRLKQQIADRQEYADKEAAERERQRNLIAAERGRQADLTGQSNVSLGTEIGRYNDVPGQIAARGQQLADYFGNHSSTMPNVMPDARSSRTADYLAGKRAESVAYNTQQNGALGNLRSLGDMFGDISRDSLQDKTHMTNLADFKQASKSLLPAEIRPIVNRQAPQITAGNFEQFGGMSQPDNTLSDVLTGVGRLGTSVGLSGGLSGMFGGGFTGTPEGLITYGSPGYAANLRYGGPK